MINLLSHIGRHHLELNGENQDAVQQNENARYTVISLADGVSACSQAKRGAEIASTAISNLLFKKADFFLNCDRLQIAGYMLSHIRYELAKQAESSSVPMDEYSSTVASVLYDRRKKRFLYFNLGDSLIMAVERGKCRIIAIPEDSRDVCCVTTTQDAVMRVQSGVMDASSCESIIICSDGAWRHMFDKNRIKPNVKELLCAGAFDALADYLHAQGCCDDYSFVSFDTISEDRRRLA